MSHKVDLRITDARGRGLAVRRFHRLTWLVTGSVLSALSLVACTSQPEYCSARDEAQQSFQELRSTNVIEDGTAALEERFQAFSSDAKALIGAAKSEFQTETDAMRTSLQQTEEVIEGLGQDAAEAAPLVSPAIDDLRTSTEELFDAVDQSCE